jgi:uncharacterized protein DUF4386
MSAAAMTPRTADAPISAPSAAGLLYLMSVVMGGAAAIVRWRLVVAGSPTATAARILAHQPLFRMLFAADLLSIFSYVAVTVLFYQMFRRVQQTLSLVTALLSLSGCAIAMFGTVFQAAALLVLRGAEHWSLLGVTMLPSLALMCLEVRAQAYQIGLAFIAFHCVLVCFLALKSASSNAETRLPTERTK